CHASCVTFKADLLLKRPILLPSSTLTGDQCHAILPSSALSFYPQTERIAAGRFSYGHLPRDCTGKSATHTGGCELCLQRYIRRSQRPDSRSRPSPAGTERGHSPGSGTE